MTTQQKIIETNLAPKAVGTYSQGVHYNGVYYFSGMLGLNPETMELATDFQGQLDQIMKNIAGLLSSQNLNKENIIKTTIFLTDLKNFQMVNNAYEKFFKMPYPARSCVEVSALPKEALVEIEVIAAD